MLAQSLCFLFWARLRTLSESCWIARTKCRNRDNKEMRFYLNRGQTNAAKTNVVINFAAGYPDGGEQLAASETQLVSPHPARVIRRSSTPTKAPGPSVRRT